MNKYILNAQLFDKNIVLPEIKLIFDNIIFKNEENQLITITKSDINIQTNYEYKDNILVADILIQDNNDKITYSLGEAYVIENISLLFLDRDENTITFELIDCITEVNETLDLKINKVNEFIDGMFLKNSCSIEGLKPPELYGYNLNQIKYSKMAEDIYNYCEQKILNENINFFITTGILGTEMIAFFAIEKLKQKYPNLWNVLIVPYEHIDLKWDRNNKVFYNKMKYLADLYLKIDTFEAYKSKYDKTNIGEFSKEKLKQSYRFKEERVGNKIFVSKNYMDDSIHLTSTKQDYKIF